jgi:CBS domain-containing protein
VLNLQLQAPLRSGALFSYGALERRFHAHHKVFPVPDPRCQSIGKGARSRLEANHLGAASSGDCGYDHRNHSQAEGHTDVATIEPEASVRRAANWLRVKNIGALVVTSGKAVLGIISEREIVHAFSRYGETVASMPVKEIMRYGVTTVSPDDSVSRVMHLMTRHRVRHMPVLREGKLAGIISIGDVVKHRLEGLECETNVLRDAYMATR